MIYGPADCDLPATVWDAVENKEIHKVLWIDTDKMELAVPCLDAEGQFRIYMDNLVEERIKFQAIYRWPETGKPNAFTCYYREPRP